jgi:hypothetical protein
LLAYGVNLDEVLRAVEPICIFLLENWVLLEESYFYHDLNTAGLPPREAQFTSLPFRPPKPTARNTVVFVRDNKHERNATGHGNIFVICSPY